MPDALMIFAAGFGTRMGALTADRPKPLIRVAGTALIDHALDIARAAALHRLVVNTHYKAGMLAAHLAGRGVALSHEPAILDTGGGLKAALPLLGQGPVFTLNSDAVWTGANPLAELAAAWDPERMQALLLLLPAAAARGYRGRGDMALDAEGRIVRGGTLVYLGAQIIDPALVAGIPDTVFSLNRAWDAAMARGTAFGLIHRGGWCDVGHPEGIAAAEALLREAGDVS
jgi:MurNAc alpha-1-phosphate uridylyltransferase